MLKACVREFKYIFRLGYITPSSTEPPSERERASVSVRRPHEVERIKIPVVDSGCHSEAAPTNTGRPGVETEKTERIAGTPWAVYLRRTVT